MHTATEQSSKLKIERGLFEKICLIETLFFHFCVKMWSYCGEKTCLRIDN